VRFYRGAELHGPCGRAEGRKRSQNRREGESKPRGRKIKARGRKIQEFSFLESRLFNGLSHDSGNQPARLFWPLTQAAASSNSMMRGAPAPVGKPSDDSAMVARHSDYRKEIVGSYSVSCWLREFGGWAQARHGRACPGHPRGSAHRTPESKQQGEKLCDCEALLVAASV
jgi:hypothetical protein